MLPGEDKLSFPAIGWVRSCNTLVSITFIVRLMNTLDLTLIYLPFDEYTRSYTYYDLISILYLLWSYTYYIYPFFARYPFFVVCFSLLSRVPALLVKCYKFLKSFLWECRQSSVMYLIPSSAACNYSHVYFRECLVLRFLPSNRQRWWWHMAASNVCLEVKPITLLASHELYSGFAFTGTIKNELS